MLREELMDVRGPLFITARMRDYAQLIKPNLSFMVVFSSVVGYLMAPGTVFSWPEVLLLFTGGVMVTGGANTINQILERSGDANMKRTADRPLPAGRMTSTEAWLIAFILGGGGVLLLGTIFNPLTGLLSLISLLLYAFAYTPMKRIHPVAVFIGAIPGAMPPLLGWVAATNSFGTCGWLLFLVQFFWQFPHYWAIAWVGFDEYKKAGFCMLPTQERDSRYTAIQCIMYSVMLIPVTWVLGSMHFTGAIGTLVSLFCAVLYMGACIIFYQKNDLKSAKQVMFASFIYLPAVLLAILFNKQ